MVKRRDVITWTVNCSFNRWATPPLPNIKTVMAPFVEYHDRTIVQVGQKVHLELPFRLPVKMYAYRDDRKLPDHYRVWGMLRYVLPSLPDHKLRMTGKATWSIKVAITFVDDFGDREVEVTRQWLGDGLCWSPQVRTLLENPVANINPDGFYDLSYLQIRATAVNQTEVDIYYPIGNEHTPPNGHTTTNVTTDITLVAPLVYEAEVEDLLEGWTWLENAQTAN